jgi:hypothetical protein
VTGPPVTGLYVSAVVLLGAAGVAKVARPADTATALGSAGLRVGRNLVRAGAMAEVAVAVAALVAPGPVPGILVAVSYLGFAAFIAAALVRHWPVASCGCFGRPDTKPTVAHLVLNAAAVAAAGWWVVASHATVGQVFVHEPWAGVPLGLATAVCCLLAYLVFTNPLAQARQGRSAS